MREHAEERHVDLAIESIANPLPSRLIGDHLRLFRGVDDVTRTSFPPNLKYLEFDLFLDAWLVPCWCDSRKV
jgi:hypothetical protein